MTVTCCRAVQINQIIFRAPTAIINRSATLTLKGFECGVSAHTKITTDSGASSAVHRREADRRSGQGGEAVEKVHSKIVNFNAD